MVSYFIYPFPYIDACVYHHSHSLSFPQDWRGDFSFSNARPIILTIPFSSFLSVSSVIHFFFFGLFLVFQSFKFLISHSLQAHFPQTLPMSLLLKNKTKQKPFLALVSPLFTAYLQSFFFFPSYTEKSTFLHSPIIRYLYHPTDSFLENIINDLPVVNFGTLSTDRILQTI